ncbi:hypothetical protein ASZ90_018502 [hydrocarbon metagenome]|uniref:PPC domain-containing protein n=1 Tax=hydrocarbon metagenome TaxID=938273 RepID=A0A0W8E635_9ZZZZ
MKYQSGRLGRVFLIQLEHGDDVIKDISRVAVKEDIASAVILLIGALKQGLMVLGPRECIVPPEGMEHYFDDGREIAAIGTLFRDGEGNPALHIHGAAGRGNSSIAGCLRQDLEVYLMVEAVVLELEGIAARRLLDPYLQVKALSLEGD